MSGELCKTLAVLCLLAFELLAIGEFGAFMCAVVNADTFVLDDAITEHAKQIGWLFASTIVPQVLLES